MGSRLPAPSKTSFVPPAGAAVAPARSPHVFQRGLRGLTQKAAVSYATKGNRRKKRSQAETFAADSSDEAAVSAGWQVSLSDSNKFNRGDKAACVEVPSAKGLSPELLQRVWHRTDEYFYLSSSSGLVCLLTEGINLVPCLWEQG